MITIKERALKRFDKALDEIYDFIIEEAKKEKVKQIFKDIDKIMSVGNEFDVLGSKEYNKLKVRYLGQNEKDRNK